MNRVLLACPGGTLALPLPGLALASREDGGNLIVHPPREVWERSELTAVELADWSALVAAAGRAMIDVLPQLDGGCINYWEAGNWALNPAAEPVGLKTARNHRRVHLHLLGRSPRTTNPAWRWGEAPGFPDFADRFTWSARLGRLTADECAAVVERTRSLLVSRYGFDPNTIAPTETCGGCRYPMPAGDRTLCSECGA